MRKSLRSVSAATCAGIALAAGLGFSVQASDCRPNAIEQLRAAAPDGFAIYQRIRDKHFFTRWITCDDVQLGLSTAVHESVHAITADEDVFPLVDGGDIRRPHEVSAFFAPSLIARRFKQSDLVTTYLRPGRASSATDFLYLLDELNAYSHDLSAAVSLNGLRSADEDVDSRDGLAALMAFVALYAQTAEESEPATWTGLQQPEVAHAVSDLWGRAEHVIASSCGIPNFGTEDKTFIRQFCQAKTSSAMQTILGRPPVCPVACLAEMPDTSAKDSTGDVTTTGSVPAGRAKSPYILQPFWSRSIVHQVSRSVNANTDETPSPH